MSSRTTRTAATLAAVAALVLGVTSLSSPTQAAPGIRDAAAADLRARPDGGVLRARPFGQLRPGKWEYYTVRLPRSGSYTVSMTGFINSDEPSVSVQCAVVDKQKILVDDFTGYYLNYRASSDAGVFDYGINETIDVELRKSRAILLACNASAAVQVLKPITVTFRRSPDFRRLPTKPFTPPTTPEGSSGLVTLR